jgi:hypothetical protein
MIDEMKTNIPTNISIILRMLGMDNNNVIAAKAIML